NRAMAYEHVATARRVNAVRVRRVGRRVDLDVLDGHFMATVRHEMKLRRVLQGHALNEHAVAADEQDEFRARMLHELPCGAWLPFLRCACGPFGAEALPPRRACAVNRARTANRHVGQMP